MAILGADDMEKLFSGAPQFFARSLGHSTGAPHPSVAFPFDEELRIRDLTDHVQIEDPAWGCVTAWPHITRGGCEHYGEDGLLQPPVLTESPRRPHFYPRCRERPNMLSIHGLEKGTMGYQAALEVSVSDALREEQFGFERLGFRPAAIIEARERLVDARYGNKDIGICQPQESEVVRRLIRCSNRYRAGGGAHRLPARDLYAELFTNFLRPPARGLDRRDPQSLSVQIQYLLKVLAAPNVWIDFSQVAWRIRLGKILWGDANEQEDDGGVREDMRAGPGGRREQRVEERYWLLLQVLLGCELLLRLDSITEGEELGVESIKPSEILRFERDANTSVKWTLILSRCWLENVDIVQETTPPTSRHPTPRPTPLVGSSLPGSWLASVTAAIVGTNKAPTSIAQLPAQTETVAEAYTIRGRHDKRQANGLVHFARKLRWPGADALASQIFIASHSAAERKPPQTPLASTVTSRNSYFGPPTSSTGSSTQSESLLQRGRGLTTILSPSGWLSRSYISGLVLPGEGLAHFLMASLLESDPDAISRLGPMANLCGGFVYSGTSFWSTACIVGRVLAAGKGATECMGWVSSDAVPVGLDEGWIDVKVDGPEGEMLSRTGKRARLWDKARVEQESGILGIAKSDGVLPADFIVPFENNYPSPPRDIVVELNSLRLTSVDGLDHAPSASTPFSESTSGTTKTIRPCLASMMFDVTGLGEVGKEHVFTLKRDVNFVTAHPCVPSHRVRFLKLPSSPAIRSIDVLENIVDGHLVPIAGHPLHKSYTYRVIHLSELLEKASTHSLEDLLDMNSAHVSSETRRQSACVLVIDCITGFAQRPPSASSASSSSSSHQSHPSCRGTNHGDDGMLQMASPSSPVLRRGGFFAHNWPDTAVEDLAERNRVPEAQDKMHLESRRRRFGSDMEVLVRALCAEKGWNAVISRRRRGCLACAIREAGGLEWQVIIRVG